MELLVKLLEPLEAASKQLCDDDLSPISVQFPSAKMLFASVCDMNVPGLESIRDKMLALLTEKFFHLENERFDFNLLFLCKFVILESTDLQCSWTPDSRIAFLAINPHFAGAFRPGFPQNVLWKKLMSWIWIP